MNPERRRYIIFESQAEPTAEAILKEIAEFKRQHGKGWGADYFNNFHLHLPIFTPDEFVYRTTAKHLGQWDVGYKETAAGKANQEGKSNYSEHFLNKTPREFYDDVDKAVAENEINKGELRKLFEERRIDDLYDQVIPVYIRLREQGYKHYPDLTA